MRIHSSLLGPDFERVVRHAIKTMQPAPGSGVAVAVLKNGKLCFAGGFGLRDRARSKKVNVRTRFAVGSATKAFTSMVLSMNAQSRALNLDLPITNYLPDFKMQDAKASSDMTLKDILSQRTGLPRHDALWYLGPFTRSQLYYRLPALPQIPGAYQTAFLYNNLMYTIAGHLLECHVATSWEYIVQTRILDPLGMASTTFTLADLLKERNHAKGYKRLEAVPLKDFDNIGPAGEINSTALDMAKWVQLFLAKGVAPDGSVLINKTNLEQMYTGVTNVGNGTTYYGLGWYVDKIQGHRHVFHDGTADGNTSYVSFMPDHGLGVVLLTNQHCTPDLVGVWPSNVAEQIYDYLLNDELTGQVHFPLLPVPDDGIEAQPVSTKAASAAASPAGFTPDDYTGMYCDPGYGDIAVSLWGGELKISYYSGSWPLLRLKGDLFLFDLHAFATDVKVPVSFHRDGGGKVASLAIPFQKKVGPIEFTRR
jgi:CubicO group peptidase (beta-lactamase class C family)